MAEQLSITRDIIQHIRATQTPVRRKYTKRQVKPLSQTGILTTRDANRSIEARKKEESAKQERKLAKQFKKVYGYEPTQRSEESIQRAIANEEAARQAIGAYLGYARAARLVRRLRLSRPARRISFSMLANWAAVSSTRVPICARACIRI